MRTVATVLRSGGDTYDAEWVGRLKRAAERYLKPDRFVCLTDVEDVPCERIPLLHDWPGWWAKLELWRPGLFEGLVFYIDLDTLIVGDCQQVWDYPGRFAALRDFTHPEIRASGLLLWQANKVPLYQYAIARIEAMTPLGQRRSRVIPLSMRRKEDAAAAASAKTPSKWRFLDIRYRMDPWWNQYEWPEVLQDLYPGMIAHADVDACALCDGELHPECPHRIVCLHGHPNTLCERLLTAWYL